MRPIFHSLCVVALCACGATAQLDTVCLVDDLPELFQMGLLLDTGGVLAGVDSVVVGGGDCDSVAASLYMNGLSFGIPLTVVRNDSCTFSVVVFGGLVDTTIDACAADVQPRGVSLSVGTYDAVRAMGKALSTGRARPEGVTRLEVLRLDGTKVRGDLSLMARGSYVARFVYAGKRWEIGFSR